MKDDVKFTENGSTLSAKLCCELDHHTVKRIREKIDRMMFEKKPRELILDFSDVSFMDSSGLGLIIGRSETASAIGASVRLCGLSSNLSRLLCVCGIEKLDNLTVKK